VNNSAEVNAHFILDYLIDSDFVRPLENSNELAAVS
jgi:hypothetical protein